MLIDLIFEPAGMRVTDEVIERGEELNVAGKQVPVMALDDILVTKLLALDEHNADYRDLLQIAQGAARADRLAERCAQRTSSSPFAAAFFTLADRLGISPASSFASTDAG